MYQLVVYYHGPEENDTLLGLLRRQIWYLNPQLYDERSSMPIWNGGILQMKVDPKKVNTDADLQSLLKKEAQKVIRNGIIIDKRGNFIVTPERIQISLERNIEE